MTKLWESSAPCVALPFRAQNYGKVRDQNYGKVAHLAQSCHFVPKLMGRRLPSGQVVFSKEGTLWSPAIPTHRVLFDTADAYEQRAMDRVGTNETVPRRALIQGS